MDWPNEEEKRGISVLESDNIWVCWRETKNPRVLSVRFHVSPSGLLSWQRIRLIKNWSHKYWNKQFIWTARCDELQAASLALCGIMHPAPSENKMYMYIFVFVFGANWSLLLGIKCTYIFLCFVFGGNWSLLLGLPVQTCLHREWNIFRKMAKIRTCRRPLSKMYKNVSNISFFYAFALLVYPCPSVSGKCLCSFECFRFSMPFHIAYIKTCVVHSSSGWLFGFWSLAKCWPKNGQNSHENHKNRPSLLLEEVYPRERVFLPIQKDLH